MKIQALLLAVSLAAITPAQAAGPRDGSHDFDYQFGTWNVRVSRLVDDSAGAKWVTYAGTHSVMPLWGGRANIGVLEIHGSRGAIEGMQLRLYDPTDGALQKPSVGAFHDGVGDFRESENAGGKTVLVRSQSIAQSHTKQDAPSAPTGTQHDFDFEFGSWTAHLKRILHPLTGDTTWVSYSGTSIVHSLLGGRENVGELNVRGSAGVIQGLTIRTFDVTKRQWNIYWVNARFGSLSNPMLGGFSGDSGLFYGSDTFDGKPILVRFRFTGVTRNHFAFEQAFSGDGGKSWEVNWMATFDRVGD